MPRQITHLVDTSYLLCFGAVPKGLQLLRQLFDGGLGAPPAVRRELERLPQSQRPTSVRAAAQIFNDRGASALVDAPLYEGDLAERDLALRCIPCRSHPGAHPDTLDEAGAQVDEVTTGDNAGEAEAIAAAFRRSVPLLINDGPATKHARARALPTEDATNSIRRLPLSPKQKYQLYLSMQRSVGNPGVPVSGQMWYRENP